MGKHPKKGRKVSMSFDRCLAITALVIACIGGLPGLLQIIKHFTPILLKGSIKFYVRTASDIPNVLQSDGFLIALTLVNEGSKEMVWRNVTASLLLEGKIIKLEPTLISKDLILNDEKPYTKDLLKCQVFTPSQPLNGYMHFNAPTGSLGAGHFSPTRLNLQFELESGRFSIFELPFIGIHLIKEGEAFPTHNAEF